MGLDVWREISRAMAGAGRGKDHGVAAVALPWWCCRCGAAVAMLPW